MRRFASTDTLVAHVLVGVCVCVRERNENIYCLVV